MYLKVEKNNFIRPNWEKLGKKLTTIRKSSNRLENF